MNAIVKREETPDTNSGLLVAIQRVAENPQADIEKMERLMALYERMEAKRAETSFNASMSAVQSITTRIAADRRNPQTKSDYATYAAIDRAIRPVYTEHGFALSFDTGADAPVDCVRVVCHVTHSEGHTRSYHVDMPADGKGAKGGDVMTKTHATGAGLSYGMRYLLKMIFNIAIGEDGDDDDGNGATEKGTQHAAWFDKIDGIADETEAEAVRKELKAAFAGTPPKELVQRWQSAAKRVKGAV